MAPEGDWDLFRAKAKWVACVGTTTLPSLILVHGLHYNCADDADRATKANREPLDVAQILFDTLPPWVARFEGSPSSGWPLNKPPAGTPHADAPPQVAGVV